MNFYGFDERSSLKLCYTDWQGNRVKKLKRGFATKKEGQAFEREFLQKTTSNLSMTFESFFEIYEKDMKSRLRETTWINKQCIIEQKILPYFKNKKMNEIKPSDIIEWQNRMITYRNEFDETEIRDKLYFSIFMLGVIEDKKVSEMQIEFELVYNPIAIFTISRKKDTVNVQVDGTRRAKQELRKMQYHNDNIQKSIKGYNEKYPRKGNSIVKMNATDKTSFVEREQNII